jgi:hypothetical protein
MGTIKRGILGGFSNKVGNIVGSSWKGIAVVKSLPLSVANPNTVPQQGVRTRFTCMVAIASFLTPIFLKKVWNRGAMQMSGFNAFVKANILSCFSAGGGYEPGTMVISDSNESPQNVESVKASATTNVITFDWSVANLVGNQKADDIAFIAVLSAAGLVVAAAYNLATRNTETLAAEAIRQLSQGELLDCYISFQSANGFRNFGQSYMQITVAA